MKSKSAPHSDVNYLMFLMIFDYIVKCFAHLVAYKVKRNRKKFKKEKRLTCDMLKCKLTFIYSVTFTFSEILCIY